MRNENKGHSPKKRMGLKKLLALMTLCTLMLSGGVFAAWQLGFFGTSTVTVSSSSELAGVLSFSDLSLNTTTSADEAQTSAILDNTNGLIQANVSFDIETTLLDPACSDYLGDCLIFLEQTNSVVSNDDIFDGDQINITSGYNSFNISVECVRASCPQQLNISVDIDEI